MTTCALGFKQHVADGLQHMSDMQISTPENTGPVHMPCKSLASAYEISIPRLDVQIEAVTDKKKTTPINLRNCCVAMGGTGMTHGAPCKVFMCEDTVTASIERSTMTFDAADTCAYVCFAFLMGGSPVENGALNHIRTKMDTHARLNLPTHDVVTWLRSVAGKPLSARSKEWLTGVTDVGDTGMQYLKWRVTLSVDHQAEQQANAFNDTLLDSLRAQTIDVEQLQRTVALGSLERRDAIAQAAATMAGPQPLELQIVETNAQGMAMCVPQMHDIKQDFSSSYMEVPMDFAAEGQCELGEQLSLPQCLENIRLAKRNAMKQACKTGTAPLQNHQIDWAAAHHLMMAHASLNPELFSEHLLAGMMLATSLRMRSLKMNVQHPAELSTYINELQHNKSELQAFDAALIDAIQMQVSSDAAYAFDSEIKGVETSIYKNRRQKIVQCSVMQAGKKGEHQQHSGCNSIPDMLYRQMQARGALSAQSMQAYSKYQALQGGTGDCEDFAIMMSNIRHVLSLEHDTRDKAMRSVLAKAHPSVHEIGPAMIAVAHKLADLANDDHTHGDCVQVFAPMICTAKAANQAQDASSSGSSMQAPTAEQYDAERKAGPLVGHSAGVKLSLSRFQNLAEVQDVSVWKVDTMGIEEGTALSIQYADEKEQCIRTQVESNDPLYSQGLQLLNGVKTRAETDSIMSQLQVKSIQDRELLESGELLAPVNMVNIVQGRTFYMGLYCVGPYIIASRSKTLNGQQPSSFLCPSAPCNSTNVDVFAFKASVKAPEVAAIFKLARLTNWMYQCPRITAPHVLHPKIHAIGDQFNFRRSVKITKGPDCKWMQTDLGDAATHQLATQQTQKRLGAYSGAVVITALTTCYAF